MTKILLFVFIVLFSFSLKAQTDPVRTELDHIFQNINKSVIPTGYLNEYGPLVVEKKWINGVLADSNFIYDIDVWNLIYNDIENSKINPAVPAMKPQDSVQSYNELARYDTATMLTFFSANYDMMREDAVLLNLFTVSNNQLFDVPVRTQCPYMTKHIFAAAPVLPESPFDNEIRIAYKPLFFGNTAKTISKVQVDFLDGSGYQNIFSSGLATQVSKFYYDSTGYKRFAIKVTYTDATTDECYSRQLVRVNTTGAMLYRFYPLSPNELATPVHRIQPATYLNRNPQIIYLPLLFDIPKLEALQKFNQDMKIYIRYSSLRNGTSLQGKIVKPLIVVEGYDITDVSRLLKPDNYGINDLITEWNGLRDLVPSFDINKKLDEEAGYDLIFIDYYTMRSITENADYLLQAIDWVNSQKVNNASGTREQNVVMGISMGGLVSRYALAKRTKQLGGNPTETKMLITMDSPHQGANVPLGLQHFLYDLGEARIIKKLKDKSDQLKAFYELNNEMATQQQLLWRVTDGNGNRVANTFLASGGHYRTMVDYNEPYQFLAVSNGSQCGQQIMAPGSLIMERSGHVAFAAWLGIALSNYKLAVQVNALPAYGTQAQICSVKMERNIRLLLGAVGTGWKTTSSSSPRMSPANSLPWDGVPGGTQNVERGGPISTKGLSIFVIVNVTYNINFNFSQQEFTFVPLTSSLDVQNVNASTFSQQFLYPANGALNGSRSDKYIAQEFSNDQYNIPHTDFTARNSRWIYNEMESISQPVSCKDYCYTNLGISGPESFCDNAVFSVPEIPGVTYTWSANNSFFINTSANNNEFTITRRRSGSALLTITVVINAGECGIFTETKTVQMGNTFPTFVGPYDVVNHTLMGVTCVGQQYYYKATDNPAGQTYTWTLFPPTGSNDLPSMYSGSTVYLTFNETGYYTLRLSKTNSCNTTMTEQQINVQECASGFGIIVAPNPASDVMTVSIVNENEEVKSIAKSENIKIDLYQFNTGAKQKQWEFSNQPKQMTLRVNTIPKGIYLLKVTIGKFSESKKIMIE